MPTTGETKKMPCSGSEKCRKLRYTIWIFRSFTFDYGGEWKCSSCGTTR